MQQKERYIMLQHKVSLVQIPHNPGRVTNYYIINERGDKTGISDLLFKPLKLELATEIRLESPLSLAELVSTGEVRNGESRPKSSLTAESGLSGSGLLWLTLALFLAALFRKERREFSICEQH